jgi:Tol biopolymer transport system component
VKFRKLTLISVKVTLVTLITLLLVVVLTRHAGATFSGMNGRIVFGRFNPAIGDDDIYAVNPDGSHEVKILAGPAECPRWAPDYNHIGVASTAGTFVRVGIINSDGSGLTQLAASATLNSGCGAWSADGSRIAFEAWDDTNPNLVPGVFTFRASDGGDLKRLTTNPFGAHDVPVDYSPDGTHLAFLRGNSLVNRHNGSVALFMANADGTNPRQITPWGLAAGSARWSPNGSRILFSNKEGGIYSINPDGSELLKVFQDVALIGSDSFPTWSPDGTKILFVHLVIGQAIQLDLYTINADGTGLTQVTKTPGGPQEHYPDWGALPLQ